MEAPRHCHHQLRRPVFSYMPGGTKGTIERFHDKILGWTTLTLTCWITDFQLRIINNIIILGYFQTKRVYWLVKFYPLTSNGHSLYV